MKVNKIIVLCILIIICMGYIAIIKPNKKNIDNSDNEIMGYLSLDKININHKPITIGSWENRENQNNEIIYLKDFTTSTNIYVSEKISDLNTLKVGDLVMIEINGVSSSYAIYEIDLMDFSKIRYSNNNEITIIFNLGKSNTQNIIVKAICVD